ncbi:hypothetical protein ACOMHN_015124 [Nucella lapillus]
MVSSMAVTRVAMVTALCCTLLQRHVSAECAMYEPTPCDTDRRPAIQGRWTDRCDHLSSARASRKGREGEPVPVYFTPDPKPSQTRKPEVHPRPERRVGELSTHSERCLGVCGHRSVAGPARSAAMHYSPAIPQGPHLAITAPQPPIAT